MTTLSLVQRALRQVGQLLRDRASAFVRRPLSHHLCLVATAIVATSVGPYLSAELAGPVLLPPSCSIGYAGTAVTIEFIGPRSSSVCNQLLREPGSQFRRMSSAGKAVCQGHQGDLTTIVRDTASSWQGPFTCSVLENSGWNPLG
ncbi:MAG TPA: hypothetical protein VMU89_22435 [Thermomicrobiaceae bacterium]|nr:hypothetical protein [Thermomicrobiaceae bacterium]HVD00383.1 hypothetical protein [Candidatus Dormibacteraeota bacterium]